MLHSYETFSQCFQDKAPVNALCGGTALLVRGRTFRPESVVTVKSVTSTEISSDGGFTMSEKQLQQSTLGVIVSAPGQPQLLRQWIPTGAARMPRALSLGGKRRQ
jgi:hypothetical protein